MHNTLNIYITVFYSSKLDSKNFSFDDADFPVETNGIEEA